MLQNLPWSSVVHSWQTVAVTSEVAFVETSVVAFDGVDGSVDLLVESLNQNLVVVHHFLAPVSDDIFEVGWHSFTGCQNNMISKILLVGRHFFTYRRYRWRCFWQKRSFSNGVFRVVPCSRRPFCRLCGTICRGNRWHGSYGWQDIVWICIYWLIKHTCILK